MALVFSKVEHVWLAGRRRRRSPDYQGTTRFYLEEVSHASKKVSHASTSDANRVVNDSLEKVYIGQQLDGTVIAIKRRVGPLRREFVDEARP